MLVDANEMGNGGDKALEFVVIPRRAHEVEDVRLRSLAPIDALTRSAHEHEHDLIDSDNRT